METDHRRPIAERIAAARQAAGLSKGALGARVGVRLWMIDRIEAGVADPPDELIEQIAEATGKSVAWLRGEDDSRTSPPKPPAAKARRRAAGTPPAPAADQKELLRLAAELAALHAERDRLAAALAQAHATAAGREAAAAAREAELTTREAALVAREQELAELTADQADIGRALIRREIRLEVQATEFEP